MKYTVIYHISVVCVCGIFNIVSKIQWRYHTPINLMYLPCNIRSVRGRDSDCINFKWFIKKLKTWKISLSLFTYTLIILLQIFQSSVTVSSTLTKSSMTKTAKIQIIHLVYVSDWKSQIKYLLNVNLILMNLLTEQDPKLFLGVIFCLINRINSTVNIIA